MTSRRPASRSPEIGLRPEAIVSRLLIAKRRSANFWELRAATSLARLGYEPGKRSAAHDLLAPIYDWFTEGFDAAALQDAKAPLDELI